ncbi:MAG: hypothetical protein EOO88_26405 [Pedobacter sp.]|nr:MAG: hypothetical protein EOO88_26405 [Pedobacter sp.]
MKTLILKFATAKFQKVLEPIMLITIMVLGWQTFTKILTKLDVTVALLDAGIWQLLVLAVLIFIGWLIIAWHLTHHFWQRLGLVELSNMVSQFKNLALWQQLGFYWASFALLLLAGVGCLAAVL